MAAAQSRAGQGGAERVGQGRAEEARIGGRRKEIERDELRRRRAGGGEDGGGAETCGGEEGSAAGRAGAPLFVPCGEARL